MCYYSYITVGIPIVSVTYLVTWRFENVIPSNCGNIARRLDDSVERLVDTFTYQCQSLNIDATVQFTYSFLSFLVNFYHSCSLCKLILTIL